MKRREEQRVRRGSISEETVDRLSDRLSPGQDHNQGSHASGLNGYYPCVPLIPFLFSSQKKKAKENLYIV